MLQLLPEADARRLVAVLGGAVNELQHLASSNSGYETRFLHHLSWADRAETSLAPDVERAEVVRRARTPRHWALVSLGRFAIDGNAMLTIEVRDRDVDPPRRTVPPDTLASRARRLDVTNHGLPRVPPTGLEPLSAQPNAHERRFSLALAYGASVRIAERRALSAATARLRTWSHRADQSAGG